MASCSRNRADRWRLSLPALMLCSLEFDGRHEPAGWKLAERLTPITYVAWSAWLIATGIALLA